MQKPFLSLSLLLSIFLVSGSIFAETTQAKPKNGIQAHPKIEVVFALDTTGSMSALINVAKSKIWSIANQLVTAKPRPEIKIGLIAYRDIGDAYVTQVTPLTEDIDDIYEKLHALKASGGGDGPEHVNQAMSDALTKIQWDKKKNVLRLIFLAGDATAHNDYDDGLNSSQLAKKIAKEGIHLNTIRCGNQADTMAQFQTMATLGNGSFVSISGGTRVVATPYDKKLADLNRDLTKTVVGFGTRAVRKRSHKKQASRNALSQPDAAANAAYSAKANRMNKEDLVQAVQEGKELDSIPKDRLSKKMQKMTKGTRKTYIAKMQKRRDKIRKSILALSKKRDAYLEKKRRKSKEATSFDAKVLKTLKKQATSIGVAY